VGLIKLARAALGRAASSVGLSKTHDADFTDLSFGGWEILLGPGRRRADDVFQGMTVQGLENAYRVHSVVYACIHRIVTASWEAPVQVGFESKSGNFTEAENHPLSDLFSRPNNFQSYAEFLGNLEIFLLTTGEAIAFKLRDRQGIIRQLLPIPSSHVSPRFDGENGEITDYRLRVSKRKTIDVPPRDIFRVYYPDPTHIHEPLAPMQAAARDYAVDRERESFMAEMLVHAHIPGLTIHTDRAMTEEQKDLVRKTLTSSIGRGMRGRPLFVHGQNTKVEVNQPLKDLDWPGLTGLMESRICSTFGVPPQVIHLRIGLEHGAFCLPANSRIRTEKGLRRIHSIVPGKDRVWTYKDGDIHLADVKVAGKTGRKLLYELHTKYKTIRASANHPFLARKASNSRSLNQSQSFGLTWVPLEDLSPGDKVVVCDKPLGKLKKLPKKNWTNQRRLSQNLILCTILDIVPICEEDVYDIEVEETHNFIAEGFVVHNSNYEQAERTFYRGTMVPMWKIMETAFTRSLIQDEQREDQDLIIRHDLSECRPLKEDVVAAADRATRLFDAGIINRNEARRIIGEEPMEGGKGEVLVNPNSQARRNPTQPSFGIPNESPSREEAGRRRPTDDRSIDNGKVALDLTRHLNRGISSGE